MTDETRLLGPEPNFKLGAAITLPNLLKMEQEMCLWLRHAWKNDYPTFNTLNNWRYSFRTLLEDFEYQKLNILTKDVMPAHIQEFRNAKDRPGSSYRRTHHAPLNRFFQNCEFKNRSSQTKLNWEKPRPAGEVFPIIAIRPDFHYLIQLRSDFEAFLIHMEHCPEPYPASSRRTYRNYFCQVLMYLETRGLNVSLEHLSPKMLEQVMYSKAKHSGKYIVSLQGALSTFFIQQVSSGRLKANPFTKRLKRKLVPATPRPLPEEKLSFLLAFPDKKTFEGLVTNAILVLALSSGLRLSEFTNLKWSELSLFTEVPYIEVRGKGNKKRKAPLTPETLAALRTIRKALYYSPDPGHSVFVRKPWFKTPLSTSAVYRRIKKVFFAAGIGGCTPHQTRHTAASHWLAWGIPPDLVRELMGHASFDTTKIYGKFTNKQLAEAHRKFHPRCNFGPIQNMIEQCQSASR